MIKIKEIIWEEIEIECTDETYFDGKINNIQVISIHNQYDPMTNIKIGYSIYSHIFDKGFDKDNVYTKLEEAKEEAIKRVENYIFGLLEIRDYKLEELLK